MAQPFVEPCDRGVIAAEALPARVGREIAPQRRRMVLAACVLASSMAFIDGSALTVALPKLRASFGADLAIRAMGAQRLCAGARRADVDRRRARRRLRQGAHARPSAASASVWRRRPAWWRRRSAG